MKDYYQVLGVGRDASDDAIKKAFRTLASKHHPDKGGSIEKFQEIQEAYAVLSDSEKKSQYDNPRQSFNTHEFNPHEFNFSFDGASFGGFNFDDFFRNMSQHSSQHQRRQPVNQTLRLKITVSLEEALSGKEISASFRLPSGRSQEVTFTIPAGVHTGTTLKISGVGDDTVSDRPRGDVLVVVEVTPHSSFIRQDNDLIVNMEVSCIIAMIGGELELTNLDGSRYNLIIPAGIQDGIMLGIDNHGMPIMGTDKRGRLLVRMKVRVPLLTEEQKSQIRALNLT